MTNEIEETIKALHSFHLSQFGINLQDCENKCEIARIVKNKELDEMEEAHNEMERDMRFEDEEKEYRYINKHCEVKHDDFGALCRNKSCC